ncbi:MAG: phosphate signaling complex protein PhoU [Candidatus Omnitrophica bacterium]|nr:phosphate signaling complex protein PhoU [Candidatus Omnitrophota bacterium]
MERHFDQELQDFKTDLLKMAAKVEESIYKSIQALKQQNKELAETVIREDKQIDEMENAIEEKAIDLLALFQPMAGDLRLIAKGIHINSELERIADLTVNICQRVLETAEKPLLKPLIDIPMLAEQAQWMVKNSIDAFVRRDENLAKEVIVSDKISNGLRTAIIKELIYDYMLKDGTTAPQAVPLLLIARDLERISDLAASIAEDVIYMTHAKVVKHHRELLEE